MKIEFDVRCASVSQNDFGETTTTLSMREPRQLSGGGLVDRAEIVLRGDRMKVGQLAKIIIEMSE